MKRFPLIPTLIVAAALTVMIGLGFWQIGRAAEKEAMLSALAATATQPPIDLGSWRPGPGEDLSSLAYRPARALCPPSPGQPKLEGGRSRGPGGHGGYVQVVSCGSVLDGRLRVVIGWAALPSTDPAPWAGGVVTGRLGGVRGDQPIRLFADQAAPGLAPAAAPTIEDIPNNHLAYAGQWFFFAAAAAIIYGLALRRRRRSDLPPAPGMPKGPAT